MCVGGGGEERRFASGSPKLSAEEPNPPQQSRQACLQTELAAGSRRVARAKPTSQQKGVYGGKKRERKKKTDAGAAEQKGLSGERTPAPTFILHRSHWNANIQAGFPLACHSQIEKQFLSMQMRAW